MNRNTLTVNTVFSFFFPGICSHDNSNSGFFFIRINKDFIIIIIIIIIITQTFFNFPWRFEFSGVDCSIFGIAIIIIIVKHIVVQLTWEL